MSRSATTEARPKPQPSLSEPNTVLPTNDLPTNDLPTNDLPTNDLPTNDLAASKRKKRLRGLIQVIISVSLLAVILHLVNWADVRTALWQINLGWLSVAWGLFLAGLVVRAARWQILLDVLKVRRSLAELTRWYFAGAFFNVLLPTGFGGDAVRVAELAQDTSRPGPVINSVIVDRYLGVMVLLAMGLGAGLTRRTPATIGVTALTALLFMGGLFAAWLLRRPWWATLSQRANWIGRGVRLMRLPVLAEAIAPYNGPVLLKGLSISLVFNLQQIGWNVAIGYGLGLRLDLATYLVFVPLTAVVLMLPAFGGLGIREVTYVGLFGSVGVPQATALALSLGVYLITVASGLVGGIFYLTGGISRLRAIGTR